MMVYDGDEENDDEIYDENYDAGDTHDENSENHHGNKPTNTTHIGV